jgi:hypothetical protein
VGVGRFLKQPKAQKQPQHQQMLPQQHKQLQALAPAGVQISRSWLLVVQVAAAAAKAQLLVHPGASSNSNLAAHCRGSRMGQQQQQQERLMQQLVMPHQQAQEPRWRVWAPWMVLTLKAWQQQPQVLQQGSSSSSRVPSARGGSSSSSSLRSLLQMMKMLLNPLHRLTLRLQPGHAQASAHAQHARQLRQQAQVLTKGHLLLQGPAAAPLLMLLLGLGLQSRGLMAPPRLLLHRVAAHCLAS